MNHFIQEDAFEKSVDKRSPFVQAAICWISPLTHWGRVSELTIIGSDNGLSPGRRQAIIWNNAGLLLIGPLGTNFSEISIGIQTFSFKKMHLNMSSAKWRPFCLGLDVINNACYPWGFVRFLQSGRQAEVRLHPYLMCALSCMLCYRLNCILSSQLHVFPKSLYVMAVDDSTIWHSAYPVCIMKYHQMPMFSCACCLRYIHSNCTYLLTHSGLMTPYGDIDLDQYWLR